MEHPKEDDYEVMLLVASSKSNISTVREVIDQLDPDRIFTSEIDLPLRQKEPPPCASITPFQESTNQEPMVSADVQEDNPPPTHSDDDTEIDGESAFSGEINEYDLSSLPDEQQQFESRLAHPHYRTGQITARMNDRSRRKTCVSCGVSFISSPLLFQHCLKFGHGRKCPLRSTFINDAAEWGRHIANCSLNH